MGKKTVQKIKQNTGGIPKLTKQLLKKLETGRAHI